MSPRYEPLPDLSDWIPVELGYGGHEPPEARQAKQALPALLRELGFEPDPIGPGWWQIIQQDHPLWFGVVAVTPEKYALAVGMPLLEPPDHPLLRLDLYDDLLQLNRFGTGSFRTSVIDRVALLSAVQPLSDIAREALTAILGDHATHVVPLSEHLRRGYDLILPEIRLEDDEWFDLFDVMRACEPPAQRLFTQVMETWVAYEGVVELTGKRVNLRAPTERETIVARLEPATKRGPAVVLGWDMLGRVDEISSEGLAAYRSMMPRPREAHITGAMIHFPCNAGLAPEVEAGLLDAVELLADALSGWPFTELAEPRIRAALAQPDVRGAAAPQPAPSVTARGAIGADWLDDLDLSPETQRALKKMDEACPSATQAVFRVLVRGWRLAGHVLAVDRNRTAIFQVAAQGGLLPLCTFERPTRHMPAQADWIYAHALGNPPAAVQRFREEMGQLDHFRPPDEPRRLMVSDGWGEPHTHILLGALLALAAAMQAPLAEGEAEPNQRTSPVSPIRRPS